MSLVQVLWLYPQSIHPFFPSILDPFLSCSLLVKLLCLECWWEMWICFCLQQFCCFDSVCALWKTVRHLEGVFCLLAIWLLHIYISHTYHRMTGESKWHHFSVWGWAGFVFNNSEKKTKVHKCNCFCSAFLLKDDSKAFHHICSGYD